MVHPILKRTIFPLFKLYIRKIEGKENIPKQGGYIIAANHESYMDHLFIGAYFITLLNKKIHFLAKKEHFDNWFKAAWHNAVGAIPVDRQAGGDDALNEAIQSLKSGKIIAIHPEGTRSRTGKIQEAKTGVARLALQAQVPVLPIGLRGTFEIMPRGKLIPKCKRGEMYIGKPMTFEEYYNKELNKNNLKEVTTKIMKEIARLAGQTYDY